VFDSNVLAPPRASKQTKLAGMPKQYAQPEQVTDPAARYEATITTGKGEIVFAMEAKNAPKTVNNFVFLARDGYYDGLTFHRYEPEFVIQGGCPEGTGRGEPGYRFADEPVLGEYIPGAVAMANAGPNTNGSQFFICLDSARHLPKQYNLFGQVIKGMDVVEAIRAGDVMQTVAVADAEA
jgi:cyclophilin family peptidyl-prolyl cis-trans isomerase